MDSGSLMGSPAEAASECAGEASGKSHRLTSTARSARNARLGALWQIAPKCAGKASGNPCAASLPGFPSSRSPSPAGSPSLRFPASRRNARQSRNARSELPENAARNAAGKPKTSGSSPLRQPLRRRHLEPCSIKQRLLCSQNAISVHKKRPAMRGEWLPSLMSDPRGFAARGAAAQECFAHIRQQRGECQQRAERGGKGGSGGQQPRQQAGGQQQKP